MRVTGGMFAGRILETPKGPRVRPTQDRVRTALFNILGDRVRGARVLDLFAGSGAMGIEALSRGAAHVTFVDKSLFCVRTIRENLGRLSGASASRGGGSAGQRSVRPGEADLARHSAFALPRFTRDPCPLRPHDVPRPIPRPGTLITRILRAEAVAAIRKLAGEGTVFDLIILDPPYGGDWARKTLNALSRCAIVSPTGWLVAEHDKRDSLPSEIQGEARDLVSQRVERYGDTALTFFA